MKEEIKQARENTKRIIKILLESDILSEEQKKEFIKLNNMMKEEALDNTL